MTSLVPADATRRILAAFVKDLSPYDKKMRASPVLLFVLLLAACRTAAPSGPYPWEPRLSGVATVLLGEVHDNATQHRLRLLVLQRALDAGWRPAIVMEQFDVDHQVDIEQARREQPYDAQHVIDLAAPRTAGASGGWNWDFYRPYIALALEHRLPLLAGNLSRRDAEKIVRDGYTAVFDAGRLAALGLASPVPWQAAQEREVDVGHCHALPREMLPAMARAQLARDAVMAEVVRDHSAAGVVLLAGDGHVRRDIGVPRWLSGDETQRVFSVGFLERGEHPPHGAYDERVLTDRQPRKDPCEAFKKDRR
jgi:uncharacterized iron-regulated protein